MKQICEKCNIEKEEGYFIEGRFILGDVPKRYLRSSVWKKKSGFARAYRCPSCGELSFYVNELH